MIIDIKQIQHTFDSSPFSNLVKVDRIYIASKIPNADGVRFLLDSHVQTFIDFKLPGEVSLNEHDLIASFGAEYINCPISSIEQMDVGFLNNMNTLLRECEGNLAIYCMSGNRIVAWLMLHLFYIQKMSVEEVYAFSQQFSFIREETRQGCIQQMLKLKP